MLEKERERHNAKVKRIQKARIKALHQCLEIMNKEPIDKVSLAVYYNEYKVQCRVESELTKCAIRNPRIEKQVRECFK